MRTVAITSGKGGVGKTNVAANLGLALAEAGKRCLLMDADMGLGNLDVVLGVSGQYNLLDVIRGRAQLREILVEVHPGLHLIPAPSGVLTLERLSYAQRHALIEQVAELENEFDLLLMDTGSGLTENVLFHCDLADGVVLVTEPDPAALTDGYALAKVLSQSYGVGNIALLINRTESSEQADRIQERLAAVCGRYLGLGLRYLGHVLQDRAVSSANARRRPVFSEDRLSPAGQAYARIAARIEAVLGLAERAQPSRRLEPGNRKQTLGVCIGFDAFM